MHHLVAPVLPLGMFEVEWLVLGGDWVCNMQELVSNGNNAMV